MDDATQRALAAENVRLRGEVLYWKHGGSRDRVTYDEKGEIDEVCASGGIHLERMNTKTWFLIMRRSDNSEFCIWFHGKITMTEERPPRPSELESP